MKMGGESGAPETPPTSMIMVVGPTLLLINHEYFEVLRYKGHQVVTDHGGFAGIKKTSTCELSWLEIEHVDHPVFLAGK